MRDGQGRAMWVPDGDPAFVVAVRDLPWFTQMMGKAVFRGRVSVVYAVADLERRGLRPDQRLTRDEIDEVFFGVESF